MVIAVPEHRTAGKYIVLRLRELTSFLYAEVGAGQIEMDVGGMPHGRDIARAMPGSAHAEKFAKGRHLARHGQPAHLRKVNANEID